jgi:hypothetical protein
MTLSELLLDKKIRILIHLAIYLVATPIVLKKTAKHPRVIFWAILACVGRLIGLILLFLQRSILFYFIEHLPQVNIKFDEIMFGFFGLLRALANTATQIFLLKAIFTGRQSSETSDLPEKTSSPFSAGRLVFLGICGVASCSFWLEEILPGTWAPVSSRLITVLPTLGVQITVSTQLHVRQFLYEIPNLTILIVGLRLILFRRKLPTDAARYAFVGWSFKFSLFIGSWVILVSGFGKDVHSWIYSGVANLSVVADLILFASIVADRRTSPAIISTTDLPLEDPLLESRRLIRRIGSTVAAMVFLVTAATLAIFPNSDLVWLILVVAVLGFFLIRTNRRTTQVIDPITDLLLEDPLFELRKLIRGIGSTVTAVVFLVAAASWAIVPNSDLAWVALFVAVIGFFVIPMKCIFMTFMMPDRKPDAFYLRSFRNDLTSYPIRVAIQTALGGKYRLTGIRDPRRRSISVWSHVVGPALWAYRNCTPKHMDLEAGDDWQLRLWNSLQNGRLAIVDLTDLTDFVHVEIRLALEALGVARVLFITNDSNSNDKLIKKIQAQAQVAGLDEARTVAWHPDRVGQFCDDVKRFAASLPSGAPEKKLPTSDYGAGYKVGWIQRRAVGFLFVFMGFQLAMVSIIFVLSAASGGARLFWPFIWSEVGMAGWYLWSLISFAREVGVPRERNKAIVATVVLIMCFTLIFVGRAGSQ